MAYLGSMLPYDTQIAKWAKISPMRELCVQPPVRIVGTAFSGTTKDTNFWSESTANGGTVTQANNEVELATNTPTANGSASYTSARKGRYVAGCANFFRGVIRVGDTGAADNVRRWGAFDTNDGAFFELNGTTLNIVTRKATADTKVASGGWNGTAFTLDTNAHTYEIWWTNSKAWFFIDDVLRHTVSASTTPWASTLTLGVTVSNTNSNGNNSNYVLDCRVASIYRFGNELTAPTYKHINTLATTVCKYGPGSLHAVVINKKGSNNTVLTVYDGVSVAGAVIGVLDPTVSMGTIIYEVPFQTGLTILTETGTAPDLTIIYE